MTNLLRVLLILVCISSASCETTPGIDEPAIFICTLTLDEGDKLYFDCYHSYSPETKKKVTLINGLGYTCVDPGAFSKLKSHHDIMHMELNNK